MVLVIDIGYINVNIWKWTRLKIYYNTNRLTSTSMIMQNLQHNKKMIHRVLSGISIICEPKLNTYFPKK